MKKYCLFTIVIMLFTASLNASTSWINLDSFDESYINTSTWEFAISDYSMALDLDPRNAEVYFNKGFALLKTGNRDDACRDYRMALKYGNKKASAEINKNCIR